MSTTMPTVSVVEARNNFSKIGAAVVESGKSVTVFKNSRPWIVISPAQPSTAVKASPSYEDAVNGVLERGSRDLEQGRYIELSEFLDKYRDDVDG